MGTTEVKSGVALAVGYFQDGESEFSVPNLLTTYCELEIGTEFIIENCYTDPEEGVMKSFETRKYRVDKLLFHDSSTGKRMYKLSDLIRSS
ncbi:MAG: hypothetical protein OXL40_12310 [Bacteroidota bacterium]|nr:hypothetical protein [Bacteroidota bacterium]